MPHGISDEGNPFDDLLDDTQNNNDTDVELPEPAIPALPPLQPDDHDHQQQEQEQEQLQGEEQPATSSTLALADVPMLTTKKLTKSYKSTLQFKTDLTKSARDIHPCGILHFTRTSGMSEEHAFVWIAHHENEAHLNATLTHMDKFGFDPNDVTFIPYSSRRSWIDKYPLAFPHVHCGENGGVSGFPYWSGGNNGVVVGGGNDLGRMMSRMANNNGHASSVAAAASGESVADAGASTSTTPTSSQRGRKKKKIFPTAHLPNDERDELHIEMYKYFQWLSNSLMTAPVGAAAAGGESGEAKQRRLMGGSAAGINLSSLQNLMENMESTFKVVRNAQPAIAEQTASGIQNGITGSTLPLLEEVLGEPLGRLVEAAKKNPETRSTRTKRSRGLDFEDMFERVLQFHQANGHVNVPQKYSQDGQLGSWVANMRSKRKQMAKKGEEYEPDVSPDNDDDGEDDIVDDEGEVGKKRKRGAGGRQRLTRDRVQRLDSIGFQWVVASPNTKSWEERFEDLKEYQQLHGTTRVPRSSGTLGEWVHMQRRLYNKKDKNFLARRAPLLDDIGFEWHPRKHALVSWEDNFNRLVEFGRLNRHYNVQSPFPEGYVGDFEEQDGEVVEAHRFSKWVKRIHAEYRSYASGKGSRMLNDARVMQLREIGFQFLAT